MLWVKKYIQTKKRNHLALLNPCSHAGRTLSQPNQRVLFWGISFNAIFVSMCVELSVACDPIGTRVHFVRIWPAPSVPLSTTSNSNTYWQHFRNVALIMTYIHNQYSSGNYKLLDQLNTFESRTKHKKTRLINELVRINSVAFQFIIYGAFFNFSE